ncbi:DUF397 domain-containing protein [Streptomyces melanogenes]|uniref:DUF397 domain-containing protein n=1 Tax=Streptomyces melanogenes TaxID=67326 RepID=UPI00167DDE69|nr:DUF397 domain-containing protein [Streptomyces melanogenes]GGP80102.1 DUF397 domain-containing protein [Streptomyces melanogenes]
MITHKPTAEELAGAAFWKSSYSGGSGNECVEVAQVRSWACVRDSKNGTGPVVPVAAHAFAALVTAVSTGAL